MNIRVHSISDEDDRADAEYKRQQKLDAAIKARAVLNRNRNTRREARMERIVEMSQYGVTTDAICIALKISERCALRMLRHLRSLGLVRLGIIALPVPCPPQATRILTARLEQMHAALSVPHTTKSLMAALGMKDRPTAYRMLQALTNAGAARRGWIATRRPK